jgi:hypothetical protein
VAEPVDPIPDPIPTITLAEVVRVLGPHFNGDAYQIADHVRKILTFGVPLFNGGHRIHPNCFPLGMIGVVGQYDPYDGKTYLEIRPLTSLDRWFWGATMCTLGRAAFEANLPNAATPQSTPPAPVEEVAASPVALIPNPPSPPPSKLLPLSELLRQLPKSVVARLRRGSQIDRVYFALLNEYPPHGKTPKSLTNKQCTKLLSKYWKAENEEFGTEDPNPEVVRVARKLLGHTAN